MKESPQQRLGREAMDFADLLSEAYGEELTLGQVIIVADLIAGDGDEEARYEIRWTSSDPRPYVQVALLAEVHDLAQTTNERREAQQLESDDDD